MIYAVISDIHANATALRKVMDDAWSQGATHIVCLGDVVGYGPEPARSVAMLRIEKATVVAGNHDDAVSGRIDASNFVDFAAEAVSRHRSALRDDEKDWLGALPYIANIEGDAVCVHGDLTAPRDFRYIETTDDAAANFAVCANPLIFVGHTHTPCLFITGKSGRTYKTPQQDFALEPGKRYIVNVGTVGYPREENGTCLSSYVIYDSERREVRYRFLPFSVASVMQRGAASPQPQQASALPPGASRQPPIDDTAAKRERRIALAALVAIVALFALALAFSMRSPQPAQNPAQAEVKLVEPAKNPSIDLPKAVTNVVLVKKGQTRIYPKLMLEKKSSPANLTINFLTQAGAIISFKEEKSAKNYMKKYYSIPPNTHRVQLIVSPANKGDLMFISRFAPYAE